jgi:preprotein translocase subunit SecY
VVPQVVYINMGMVAFASVFGGTAILIAVGVTLDTATQIESHIVARNYEAFMSKTSKMKSGIGSTNAMRQKLLRR